MSFFLPEDGGAPLPLTPVSPRVQEVMLPDQGVDPNLVLLGVVVLGVGLLALIGVAYLAHLGRNR